MQHLLLPVRPSSAPVAGISCGPPPCLPPPSSASCGCRVAADDAGHQRPACVLRKVKQTFGEKRSYFLVIEDQQLLHRTNWRSWRLSTSWPHCRSSRAPKACSACLMSRASRAILDKEPYLAKLPETPQEGAALLTTALKNPLIRNLLVSPGGNADGRGPSSSDGDGSRRQRADRCDHRTIAPLEQAYTRVSDRLARFMKRAGHADHGRTGRLMPLAVGALLIALPLR